MVFGGDSVGLSVTCQPMLRPDTRQHDDTNDAEDGIPDRDLHFLTRTAQILSHPSCDQGYGQGCKIKSELVILEFTATKNNYIYRLSEKDAVMHVRDHRSSMAAAEYRADSATKSRRHDEY